MKLFEKVKIDYKNNHEREIRFLNFPIIQYGKIEENDIQETYLEILPFLNSSKKLEQFWQSILNQIDHKHDQIFIMRVPALGEAYLFNFLIDELINKYKAKNPCIVFYSKKQSDVFNAFRYTDFDNVKVVILGQDPYHGPNQAEGLSFSVSNEVLKPPSLKNIFKELESDLGIPFPKHNSLKPWAKEGVLLLNAVLTVEAHTPTSHKDHGWEQFTDQVIEIINKKTTPVVFILWGSYARAKKKLITNPIHYVIESAHPSPFSAYNGFFGSKPFSKTNEFLKSKGLKPIDWRVE